MHSSKRNRLVTIEKRTDATGPLNQPLDVWEPVFSDLWANISGASGLGAIRESNGGVPDKAATYSICINFRPTGIDEGMRVNHGGEIFNIVKIRHDFATKADTFLICTHGANSG